MFAGEGSFQYLFCNFMPCGFIGYEFFKRVVDPITIALTLFRARRSTYSVLRNGNTPL